MRGDVRWAGCTATGCFDSMFHLTDMSGLWAESEEIHNDTVEIVTVSKQTTTC